MDLYYSGVMKMFFKKELSFFVLAGLAAVSLGIFSCAVFAGEGAKGVNTAPKNQTKPQIASKPEAKAETKVESKSKNKNDTRHWKKIDSGLYIGEFIAPQKARSGSSKIIVVKINPWRYQLKLLTASQMKHDNLTAPQWCNKYNLIAAVNAGMYLDDYKSNVGYMKNGSHVNNKRVNSIYLSVAAFNRTNKKRAPFKIYDMDVTKMKYIQNNYKTVIQNLRLIKRPRQNKWSQQPKKWSEVALGQDKAGNILFIFSPTPLSMHDFNNILLSLPIQLQCAQHLEGGPEASLFFSHNGAKLQLAGLGGFGGNQKNVPYWPIPNVLGIVKRK